MYTYIQNTVFMLLSRFLCSGLMRGVASEVTMRPVCNNRHMRYLNQTEATSLDQELFNEYKFSVDQLMELAGLSVASAVARAYPPNNNSTNQTSALVVCGPGNNGGDGLVAARHLVLFNYSVSVFYPKRTPKPLYDNLLHQCKKFGVNIVETLPRAEDYQILVDALFGFSFKPPVRTELKPALDLLINSPVPVCSVDIPSGWNVDKGPDVELGGKHLKPAMLVSLSAPKLCAQQDYLSNTKHFLGGRFLPPELVTKYNLSLPEYPDQDQVVQISC